MAQTSGTTITCKAALCWGLNKPLTVENIEVAPPKKGEVRIKIVSSGICHSDAHVIWRGKFGIDFKYPVILGHEGAGIIESVGEDVVDFVPGDHVLVLFSPQCKKCVYCKNDNTNFCLSQLNSMTSLMEDGTTRFSLNDKPVYHCFGTSTFSEYTVCSQHAVSKINPKADLSKVCLIACCIGTGYGSAVNIADVKPDSVCAIWGLGSVGLSVALGCKERRPKKIIGVDINENKFEIGRSFGIDEFVNPLSLNQPIEEYFKKIGGIDYTFECIGTTQTIKAAVDSLSPWGTAVIIGLGPNDETLSLSPMQLLTGRSIKGGFYGGYKMVDGAKMLTDKFVNGDFDLDKFITHNLNLDQISQGFDLLKQGKCLKTVIHMK